MFLAARGGDIVKKLFTLLCGTVIAFSFSTATFPQQAPSQKKMNRSAREGRWEGNVVRSNPERSTLTVREIGSTEERIIHYDGMTRCVNQEHGSKKVNQINPTQIKDGDRVIARGIWDKGVLYATLISKRLSHSQ
jgi:hypothetical protein